MREEDFGFIGSFNMGYEGFSKPISQTRMHPILGGRGEYLVLLGLLGVIPLLVSARKKNEDALRS